MISNGACVDRCIPLGAAHPFIISSLTYLYHLLLNWAKISNFERERYVVPTEENSSVRHANLQAHRGGGPRPRQNSTAGQSEMTQTGKTASSIFGTVLILFEQPARSVNVNAVAHMPSPDAQAPKPLPHAVSHRQRRAEH